MKIILNILLVSFASVLFLFSAVSAAENSMLFGNVNMTFNDRLGIYDLGYDHEQKENKSNMKTYGASLGKFFALPSRFRIALPIAFDYGTVKDGTIEDVVILYQSGLLDTVDTDLKCMLINVALSPQLQYVFKGAGKLHPYAGIGGGIHYVKMKEEMWNGKTLVEYPGLQSFSGIRWSICAELGAEILINRYLGLSAHYQFRYWYPVKDEYSLDLPYKSVDYRERFFSHQIGIGFLIGN